MASTTNIVDPSIVPSLAPVDLSIAPPPVASIEEEIVPVVGSSLEGVQADLNRVAEMLRGLLSPIEQ